MTALSPQRSNIVSVAFSCVLTQLSHSGSSPLEVPSDITQKAVGRQEVLLLPAVLISSRCLARSLGVAAAPYLSNRCSWTIEKQSYPGKRQKRTGPDVTLQWQL